MAGNTVVHCRGGPLQGHLLVALAPEQPGDLGGDQRTVGIEAIGDGLDGNKVKDVGEIRAQHGLATREVPPLAAHLSGVIHYPLYFLKGQLVFFLLSGERNLQPTMAAVIVAAISEV